MIKAALDLHIHSCLSPCAEEDMTPNNIVQMAMLKGLDMIAVCDHNHTGNLKAVSKVAEEKGIVLLPGLELETAEEIHLLCYFPSLDCIQPIQNMLNQENRNIPNREDIFGTQWILDCKDQPVKKVDHLLCTATRIDLYKAVSIVRELGGVAVPAHVNRDSYSILSNLGSIPEELFFSTLELSRNITFKSFLKQYPEYGEYLFISSSDAHQLGMILEREFFLHLEELSLDCLLTKLRGKKL